MNVEKIKLTEQNMYNVVSIVKLPRRAMHKKVGTCKGLCQEKKKKVRRQNRAKVVIVIK